MRQAATADFLAQLDEHLLKSHPARGDGVGISRILRTPMAVGRSCVFLHLVRLCSLDDTAAELVEKGVKTHSPELAFWGSVPMTGLVPRGDTYRVVQPISIVQGEHLSALYFPYVEMLDRQKSILRREFGFNMRTTAAATAEFNGRNLRLGANPSPVRPFVATRPAIADLQRILGLSIKEATSLQQSWDEANAVWVAKKPLYERLPRCVCHNDVSPGNSVRFGGVTYLSDFGLANVGPVGSDLHTLLRWSEQAMTDHDHVEELFRSYLGVIRRYVGSVDLEEVRFAAWATFFLRYTNLKYRSARDVMPFTLAVQQMLNVAASAYVGV